MNTKIVYSQKSEASYTCSLKIQYRICLPSTTLTDCWEGPQYITQGLPSFGSSYFEDCACFAVSNLSFIAKAYAMWAPVTLFPVPARCRSHHYTSTVDEQYTVYHAGIPGGPWIMTKSLLQARSIAFLWYLLTLTLPEPWILLCIGQSEVALEACSSERIVLTLGGSADKETETLHCIHSNSVSYALTKLSYPCYANSNGLGKSGPSFLHAGEVMKTSVHSSVKGKETCSRIPSAPLSELSCLS